MPLPVGGTEIHSAVREGEMIFGVNFARGVLCIPTRILREGFWLVQGLDIKLSVLYKTFCALLV